jgi:hypothetical protein
MHPVNKIFKLYVSTQSTEIIFRLFHMRRIYIKHVCIVKVKRTGAKQLLKFTPINYTLLVAYIK